MPPSLHIFITDLLPILADTAASYYGSLYMSGCISIRVFLYARV